MKVVTKFPEPLRIQPRFGEGYKDKVVALYKNGDISSAIKQVKRGIELNLSLSGAHVNLERLIQPSVKEVHNFWNF